LVEAGAEVLLHLEDPGEDGPVRVPAGAAALRPLHLDEAGPRLHQAARQEAALPEDAGTVALAERLRLAGEVEGLADGGRGEHRQRAPVSGVRGAERVAAFELDAEGVELLDEAAAAAEAGCIHALRRGEVRQADSAAGGVRDRDGVVRGAEDPRAQ